MTTPPTSRAPGATLRSTKRLMFGVAIAAIMAACTPAQVTTPAPDLELTNVSPTTGDQTTLVTVTGVGIAGNAAVTVGGQPATNVAVLDAADVAVTPTAKNGVKATFNPPELAADTYDVTVTQGMESDTLFDAFTFVPIVVPPPALSLSGIDPDSGDDTTLVTVTGEGIAGTASVTVGGVAATNVIVRDAADTVVAGSAKTGVTVTFNPPVLADGAHDVVVSQDAESDTLFGAFTYVTPILLSYVRINAGCDADLACPAFVDAAGDTWQSDTEALYTVGINGFDSGIDIAGTDDDELYQTERYGANFVMTIPVPAAVDDTYTVRLHFAELFWGVTGPGEAGGVGSRVFDVSVQGDLVLDGFDIVETAGAATAYVHEVTDVIVSDGSLVITFAASVDNAKISAVEVAYVAAP